MHFAKDVDLIPKNQEKFYTHLGEPQLEYESAHLGDARRPLLEALQVVRGQDEESLLPPREHLVPLLPQQPLAQRRRVPQAAENTDGSSVKISHFIQQIPGKM